MTLYGPACVVRSISFSSRLVVVTALVLLSACGGGRPRFVPIPTPGESIAPAIAPIPYDAFDLLGQSLSDSCSICAERHRKEAFELLSEAYRPGTVLRSGSNRRFTRVDDTSQMLALTDFGRDTPLLALRFHTQDDHLVGIAEADFTDPANAAKIAELAAGLPFDGAVQVVAWEYGDGPSYVFSRSSRVLEVQCKVLEVYPLGGVKAP